ncbi:MAG: hypothetical protein K6F90_07750 [Lachnospiraceae bacterium]|nr:hypothetical protein [Lachnospiraceae bacterium]
MKTSLKDTVRQLCRDFAYEEDGMGTVEIILIIVVLVGLVIIFKNQITSIVNDLFDNITDKTDTITN